MKTITKTMFAGLMSAIIAAGSVVPASAAMPIPTTRPAQVSTDSNVEQVSHRRWQRQRHGYYHGQRGYRSYRHGYRRHNDGWWYPLAAFGAGAIIGGAATSHYRPAMGNRHVEWCLDRYRTYRPSDNTYVRRAGVRAECISPYSR